MARRYSSFFERIRANVRVDPVTGCWLWVGKTRRCAGGPRPSINIRRNGKHCTCSVPRLVIEQFYLPGPWESSHVCTDETWMCVHPEHVIPETKQQNMARRWGRPLPKGKDWPKQPGEPPEWREPEDPSIEAGEVAEECPF